MAETDCEQTELLMKECFSVPWSVDALKEMFYTKGYCSFLAKEEDAIIGYIGMKVVLDEADITNVAVDAACRKCGVGERMLLELLKAGEDRGVRAFTLEVRESNLAALALYQKIGFEECGVRKNFYDFPKENAVIMWKYLQSFPIG